MKKKITRLPNRTWKYKYYIETKDILAVVITITLVIWLLAKVLGE